MTAWRRASLILMACWLSGGAVSAAVRVAPTPVQVPGGVFAGAGVAGAAAAALHQQSAGLALPVSPSLTLPRSVIPAPGMPNPVAALAEAARVDVSLRAAMPQAAVPGVTPRSAAPAAPAAELLAAPGEDANGIAPARGEAKSIREKTAAAIGWKEAGPGGARIVDKTQSFGRFNALFDGSGARQAASPVPAEQPAADVAYPSLSGAALRNALRADTAKSYHSNSYHEAMDHLFSAADNVVQEGVHGVVDAYSGIFVPGTGSDGGSYKERGDEDGDGYPERNGMNVEHVWPQSYFEEKLPMRSDLHHLMATFQHPNSMRGRLPFGEVPAGRVEYHNRFGAKMGAGLFEPPDVSKGRVARAMLYFFTRYGDRNILAGGAGSRFWNGQVETLLRWNRQFPPTAFERQRNSAVEKFQGNRNPFIDDPSLAERIGIEGFRIPDGRAMVRTSSDYGGGSQVQGRPSRPYPQRSHPNRRRR